ncbi:hypothetical protein [Kocuria atrinae]|uniref:hypothetical protein n=1 Tax=Kocuria atrinae TaxID=592377 RepID=UPI0002E9EFC2|nr:hypothetical protein [Kocuria atrinae]
MPIEAIRKEQRIIEADIGGIVGRFSGDDREKFSGGLLAALQTSDVVKILDENQAFGPGTLRDVLQVCFRLGKTDASLAWVVGVSNSAWSMRGNFTSLGASDALMEDNRILAMVLGRPGSLKRDDASGDWLVNGEWKFASASQYASIFFCLAAVDGAEEPDLRVVAIPADELEITADWQAVGLRGTQSVTVSAQDIRISDCHTENYARILAGESRLPRGNTGAKAAVSYSHLFTGVLMNCLVGAVLGATEAGLEYVTAVADEYPIAGSTYSSMSSSGAVRAEIGRLRGALDLYKRAAEYNADIIDEAAGRPTVTLTVQDRLDIRERATQVMRGCVDIVQDLLWIFGSSGLNQGHPLERIWRDVNVGARHGGFSKFVPEEAVGLALVGRDPGSLTQMF